jgi:hypothetical protein
MVHITSSSRVALECLAVTLSHGAQAKVSWSVPSLQEKEFAVSLAPWPVKANLATLKATLLFQQPSGRTFSLEVTPSLEVLALYDQDDSIYKDLGL